MLSSMFRLSPGKTVGAFAVLAVAVFVAIGSGADLTAGTASPGNFVTSGALSMSNADNGTAKFRLENVEPGFSPSSGKILFRNTGTVPGTFSVNPAKSLSDSLVAARRDDTDTLVPVGSVFDQGGLTDGSVLKRLSGGLHWQVYNLAFDNLAGPNQGCDGSRTDSDCYTPTGGPLANGTLYDAGQAGPINIGTIQPDAYGALFFQIDWPTTDAASATRAGVKSDWSIQITATT